MRELLQLVYTQNNFKSQKKLISFFFLLEVFMDKFVSYPLLKDHTPTPPLNDIAFKSELSYTNVILEQY